MLNFTKRNTRKEVRVSIHSSKDTLVGGRRRINVSPIVRNVSVTADEKGDSRVHVF
jgi:hypothetical protein